MDTVPTGPLFALRTMETDCSRTVDGRARVALVDTPRRLRPPPPYQATIRSQNSWSPQPTMILSLSQQTFLDVGFASRNDDPGASSKFVENLSGDAHAQNPTPEILTFIDVLATCRPCESVFITDMFSRGWNRQTAHVSRVPDGACRSNWSLNTRAGSHVQ